MSTSKNKINKNVYMRRWRAKHRPLSRETIERKRILKKLKKKAKNLEEYKKILRKLQMRDWRKENPELAKAIRDKWNKENPEKVKEMILRLNESRKNGLAKQKYVQYQRKYHILKKYGITIDEYNAMFILQDGNCAICKRNQGKLNRNLAVDHNHETGKVRGLLCTGCNHLLGGAFDSVEILESAINYLKIHAI